MSSAIGYGYTIWAGGLLSRRTAGRDLGKVNRIVLLGLASMIFAFNGLPGLALTGVAALVGALPVRLGIRRVHLTGCLLLPLIIFYLGLEGTAIGLLW